MGRTDQFVELARAAGLTNAVPESERVMGQTLFLAHSNGVMLAIIEEPPSEGDETSLSLVYGEQNDPNEDLPRIKLRFDASYDAWVLEYAPDDVDIPKEMKLFGDKLGVLEGESRMLYDDKLESIAEAMIGEAGRRLIPPALQTAPVHSRVPIGDLIENGGLDVSMLRTPRTPRDP
jgi:hypothetical protein